MRSSLPHSQVEVALKRGSRALGSHLKVPPPAPTVPRCVLILRGPWL